MSEDRQRERALQGSAAAQRHKAAKPKRRSELTLDACGRPTWIGVEDGKSAPRTPRKVAAKASPAPQERPKPQNGSTAKAEPFPLVVGASEWFRAKNAGVPKEAYGKWTAAQREAYHTWAAQERRVYRPDYGVPPEPHTERHRRVIVNDWRTAVLCYDCARRNVWLEVGRLV